MLLEVAHALVPGAADAVRALAARVTAAQGHPSVDPARLDHAVEGRAPGLVTVLAWDTAHRDLVGYAQALRGRGGWDVERMVAPEPPDVAAGLGQRLVATALHALGAEDGSDVRLWVYQASDRDDRVAAALGLHPSRDVLQMRRPLPVPGAGERHLLTRPFVVGQDEQSWLTVNNRAFAWHPEQSGWTLAGLQAREREPWFDPAGFLLHEREGRLVGFCWTKIHRDTEPALGEIYVIAVDPDWHGRGLGRALTLAGLDHLAAAGLTVGMLYVEATNTPAVRLYEDMGFTVDHVDRVYRPPGPMG